MNTAKLRCPSCGNERPILRIGCILDYEWSDDRQRYVLRGQTPEPGVDADCGNCGHYYAINVSSIAEALGQEAP